jgi:hypothetical protein
VYRVPETETLKSIVPQIGTAGPPVHEPDDAPYALRPAIVSALYNFAYLTLQRHLGFGCETFSDQSDSIANFETIFQVRLSLPLHSGR